MKELTLEATIENIAQATAFVDEQLDVAGCPAEARRLVDVAVDELLSNVAQYAYAPGTGMVTVRLQLQEDPQAAVISFIDSGAPFDPLASTDPDTSLPLKKRRIGGLGIYMVKKSMDDMRYEYRDGCNVVTITKKF